MENFTVPPVIILSGIFLIVSIASKQIGKAASKLNLPYITGYLLTGVLAGAFVFGLLPSDAAETLRYIDELSLAVIAFVAGSEVYLPDLRSRLRSITASTAGIVIAAFLLIGAAIFVLTNFISFTDDMGVSARLAVALLGATVLLALSPASTIAVMQESRAKGEYSSTVLSITVLMDVVIVVLFAITVAVADVLIAGSSFQVDFIGLLAIDLVGGVLLGLFAGVLMRWILSADVPKLVKIIGLLVIGGAIFYGTLFLLDYSKASLPITLHIEPILAAMTAGFYVTNFTNQRQQFEDTLHDISPIIYVAFFTLTGVSLKLDILLATLPIAGALFATRIGAIFIGSNIGGRLARAPKKVRNLAWMGLITQAGIALGLAREVAIEFPSLGDSFATLVISVVVLNEIFGPMFLKSALKRVGEAAVPDDGVTREEHRDAVIFGIEEQSIRLAKKLAEHNWSVCMVDTDPTHLAPEANTSNIRTCHVGDLTFEQLEHIVTQEVDAVVAMLPNDSENYHVIEMSYEKYGIPRLIARLNDLSSADKFTSLGAIVVDPASGMVNLLDRAVRAPMSAELLLHPQAEFETIQITVTNPDVNGRLVRDLRLPEDVLLMEVIRRGVPILANGYTRLRTDDEITLLGKSSSLEAVTLRLGY